MMMQCGLRELPDVPSEQRQHHRSLFVWRGAQTRSSAHICQRYGSHQKPQFTPPIAWGEFPTYE